MKMNDRNLRVGNKVIVINAGNHFSIFLFMFKKLGFKLPETHRSFKAIHINNKTEFEIFGISKHHQNNRCVVGIRNISDPEEEYLFNASGVKKIGKCIQYSI